LEYPASLPQRFSEIPAEPRDDPEHRHRQEG
jgi:hypothetical protein